MSNKILKIALVSAPLFSTNALAQNILPPVVISGATSPHESSQKTSLLPVVTGGGSWGSLGLNDDLTVKEKTNGYFIVKENSSAGRVGFQSSFPDSLSCFKHTSTLAESFGGVVQGTCAVESTGRLVASTSCVAKESASDKKTRITVCQPIALQK